MGQLRKEIEELRMKDEWSYEWRTNGGSKLKQQGGGKGGLCLGERCLLRRMDEGVSGTDSNRITIGGFKLKHSRGDLVVWGRCSIE